MLPQLTLATNDDAQEIHELRAAVSADLGKRFGDGHWVTGGTVKGVLYDLRNSRIFVAREGGKIIGTVRLATKKPWAIDRSYFTSCKRPIYLTSMAVLPEWQGKGVGRHIIEESKRIVREWPGQAIYLDAYDAVAGAGEFYRKCGFQERGRVVYRKVPLIYFELMV